MKKEETLANFRRQAELLITQSKEVVIGVGLDWEQVRIESPNEEQIDVSVMAAIRQLEKAEIYDRVLWERTRGVDGRDGAVLLTLLAELLEDMRKELDEDGNSEEGETVLV